MTFDFLCQNNMSLKHHNELLSIRITYLIRDLLFDANYCERSSVLCYG